MRSFVRMSGSMAAVALAGAALTALAPGQAMAAGPRTIRVFCSANALASAITTANGLGAAIISLPANCSFNVATPATPSDGLPVITGAVTLAGGRNTVIRRTGVAAFRLLDVAASGTLIMNSVSVTGGRTAGQGGGILDAGTLIVDEGTFSGNTAANGGAVSISAGATARITDALFAGNTTTGVGGGAIINFGTLTLNGSILTGNTAPINGGALNTQPAGTSRISQSTFTRNTSGGLGGAISNLGTTSLFGSTVRLNKGSGGGGIANGSPGTVTLRDTNVVANTPDNCNPTGTIRGCIN
jgi:predicted outer membrane repeat protein